MALPVVAAAATRDTDTQDAPKTESTNVGSARGATNVRDNLDLTPRRAPGRITETATDPRGATKAQRAEAEIQQQASRTRDAKNRPLRVNSAPENPITKGEGSTTYQSNMSTLTFLGMIAVAVGIDAVQMMAGVAVIGVITGIISYIVALLANIAGWLIFGIWFAINGMSLFKGRRLAVATIGFIGDSLLAGFVPNWTITVVVAYGEERLKERGIDILSAAGKLFK